MIEANYDEVICPNCVTQFRAIPVNVQDQITALTTERDFFVMANKDLNSAMGRYEDLHAAARLALDALTTAHINVNDDMLADEIQQVIAALKAVL